MNKLEKEDRTAGKGILARNCVSESGHAAATYNLQVCGNIDLQHCAARDQSESNNDFGREIELLVHGRKHSRIRLRGVWAGLTFFLQSCRGEQYLLISGIGSPIDMTSKLLWLNSLR